MSASISSLWRTTAATNSRARSAATGSRSVSTRWRSRMASAVRCPKSASKIAASASRRPVRRPRCRSASDAIDDDGDGAEVETEQAFDGGRHGRPYLRSQRTERLTRPRDDAEADEHAVVDDPDANGRAGEPGAPCRSRVADARDAGDLERRGLHELADDPLADGQ